ncbi:hypothetical protein [Halorubrum tebenquichense]|uniref:SWIM-type domain-containing protein n=1 Tax=Halorubrum tebenquichense DSM 14210 TaxID=1227485 RepID=M0DML3_9EURY|nr:hypothetical protein [Halorubrum tebenquichense]ELZ35394.1 hypothetical protein C472_12690 [Halorubrum tebenquichense DSM 14210]
MSEAASGGVGTFKDRAADALTSYMTVLEDLPEVADDSERFAVISDSGSQYIVDCRAGTCTCPDMLHRRPDGGCRHLRRVSFARGAVPIPGWVEREAIDPQLGQHLAASPRIATADGRTEVFEPDV